VPSIDDDGVAVRSDVNQKEKLHCVQKAQAASDCVAHTQKLLHASQSALVPCPASGVAHVFQARAFSCPSKQCQSINSIPWSLVWLHQVS